MERGPPERVRFAVMLQRWTSLSFLHWAYPPEEIRSLVPNGVELDLWEGSAWVSLTPFLLEGLRPPFAPPVPWLSRSPETNLRTYVRGPDGCPGILFFSLEIGRLPAVVAGRVGYSLPYMWSRVAHEGSGASKHYRGQRLWPKASMAYRITIEPQTPLQEREVDGLANFLTARFRLYSQRGGRVIGVSAEHPPWPLWRARAVEIEENLMGVAGLKPPEGPPLVHFSPGVDVRIGPPKVVRSRGQ